MPHRSIVLPFSLLLAAVGGPLACAADVPSTIYVSQDGDDANPGTEEQPIATIKHAQELVRRINQNMSADITINIKRALYRLSEPLVLQPQDSGSNGHNIIWTTSADRPATLSGSVQLMGWTQIDTAKDLWSATVPEQIKNLRQFYVGGNRATRTQGRSPVSLTPTPTGYTASSDALARFRNPEALEFVYTGGNKVFSEIPQGLGPWTEPRIPVASIRGTTITMIEPAWSNSTKRVMLPAASGFRRAANLVGPSSVGKTPAVIENAYEFLGKPGEFYFDPKEHKIYYTPRPEDDLTMGEAEAPLLEQLVIIKGSPENPVHHVVFSNLQFSYAAWNRPNTSEGFSEIQANYCLTGPDAYAKQGLGDNVPGGAHPFGDWTPIDANISVSYARNIQFIRTAFCHLGGAGLHLGHGSQNNKVEGCVFEDISGNGLMLGGVNKPDASPSDVTRDNTFSNNHFTNVPAEFHGGIPICVGYAQNTLISHNQIDHIPYTAISIGWGGWPDKINQPGIANFSQNNRIEYNLIHHHMLLLCDGGGIYTQGITGPDLARGEKLIGNVIYNQYSTGHGIYTDNGCTNVTANDNVVFNTNHDNWGIRHKSFYNGEKGENFDVFHFENNYWQQGDPDLNEKQVTLKNNHLISALEQVPDEVFTQAGLESDFKNILKRTITSHTSTPSMPPARVAAHVTGDTALVTFSPPIDEGDAPVTLYTVTSSTGQTATITPEDLWSLGYVAFSNLNDAREYTFTVTATNAQGTSAPSVPSLPVAPIAAKIPQPPAITAIESANGIASIHFTTPKSDGGSPVVAIRFTAKPADDSAKPVTKTFTGRMLMTRGQNGALFTTLDGLKPGVQYTLEAQAVTIAGISTSGEKSFTAR